MRKMLPLFALALAACGQTTEPEPPPPIESHAAPHTAISNTSMSLTGDVTIQRGGLVFAHGIPLFTRTLDPRAPTDRINQAGDSYLDVVASVSSAVQLRRVTNQVIAADAPNRDGVCGAGIAPSYVALMQDARAISLVVFTGEEVPSPNATQSQVCATYLYDAEPAP